MIRTMQSTKFLVPGYVIEVIAQGFIQSFCQVFQSFCQVFQRFCQVFQKFCQVFQRFCQVFQTTPNVDCPLETNIEKLLKVS